MADRVFCIDFGSAYTKVALRRDPGAEADVIPTGFGMIDVPKFCFPSAVAVERQGTKNLAVCGPAAMTRSPASGASVHTNWKKRVFLSAEPGQPPQKPPLDAFLESPELHDLAARFGVTAGQLVHLQNVVANARSLVGGSGVAASPDAKDRAVATSVAYHYFTWLREEVLRAAQSLRLDGLDPAAIPVRITVPAFAPENDLEQHPGTQLLLHALTRAGWRLHATRPVVSEPYANVIGVLSGGANAAVKGKVQLRKMFGNGPVMRPLADAAHHPAYRAVVVDVGAFTTDFATVTLDTRGAEVDDPDPAFAVRQHSVPLGVGDLDARVFDALPKDKRHWLTKVADPVVLEGFRQSVYSAGKPYKTVEVGAIGGGADAEAVAAGVDAFLQQLRGETAKFCDPLESIALQELVLTGGGVNIPRVREALVGAAQGGGRAFAKTYAAGLKRGSADGLVSALGDEMARGGSAIGGASIYYEREYY